MIKHQRLGKTLRKIGKSKTLRKISKSKTLGKDSRQYANIGKILR